MKAQLALSNSTRAQGIMATVEGTLKGAVPGMEFTPYLYGSIPYMVWVDGVGLVVSYGKDAYYDYVNSSDTIPRR